MIDTICSEEQLQFLLKKKKMIELWVLSLHVTVNSEQIFPQDMQLWCSVSQSSAGMPCKFTAGSLPPQHLAGITQQNLRHNSATPDKLYHPQRCPHPFAPVGCLPMWTQPQQRPPRSIPGMQHNNSKGWPLKQNISLLFTKFPEMFNCFIALDFFK